MALVFGAGAYLGSNQPAVTGYPATFAVWARTPQTINGHLLSVGSASGNDLMSVGLWGQLGGRRVIAPIRSGGQWGSAPVATSQHSPTEWFHAAAVFTSATQRAAYLDGGAKETLTTPASPTGLGVTRMNARPGLPPSYSGVQIAEAAIWTAALEDEELRLLAAGVSPLALRARLSSLAFYADGVRRINRPGIGPQLTQTGVVTASSHPRVWRPTPPAFAPQRRRPARSFHAQASQAALSGADAGEACLAGFDAPSGRPAGEVVA